MIDLTIHPDRLERTVKRARERNIIVPTFKQMQNPALIPDEGQGWAEERRPVGHQPAQPVPHHLAQRAGGEGRRVRRRQLPGAAQGADRRGRPHHRHGGQVVPHRRAQGRRGVRLPGAPPGHRPVRPDHPEGRLAVHRQLLPRRRLRLGAAGLPVHRHPARRDEQGTLRVAVQGRRRSDRHPRHREQRQGNLRQVLGAAPLGPGPDDLQPVRRVRQRPVAPRRHRQRVRRSAGEGTAPRRNACAARSSPPAPRAPSTRATG